MKKINKILPILGTVAVGAIPFTATSCSKVWIDMLEKQYQPNFEPYKTSDKSGEVTSIEVIDAYKNYFLKNKQDLIPDFYWGASFYGRHGLETETQKVLTFLQYIESMDIAAPGEEATMDAPLLSYHTKAQLELKQAGLSKSYAINTYDLDWQFNNLQVWPVHYDTIKVGNENVYCWSISPIKFDNYNSIWWDSLAGNEQIKFDFKAVYKGYSENGAQNYVRETNEAAIIDEAHKYTPELNEVYTNVMLFDSYYLSKSKPRIDVDDANVDAWLDSETAGVKKYTTDDITFEVGSGTHEAYKNYKLKFSVYKDKAFIYPEGTGIDVKASSIQIHDPITIGEIPLDKKGLYTVKLNPTFEITGSPKVNNYLYYVIKLDCVKDGEQTPAWSEYLFTTAYLHLI